MVFVVGCGMVIMLVSLWLCVDCTVSVLISVDYALFNWWFNSVVALVFVISSLLRVGCCLMVMLCCF